MKNLVIVTVIVCLILGVVYSILKINSESQVYGQFETQFFKSEESFVEIVPWEQNLFLEKKPNLILWTEVYLTAQGEILVKPWIETGSKNRLLPQAANPARPLLKDLLLKFAQTRFLIHSNDTDLAFPSQLKKLIEEVKAEERIILNSDFDSFYTQMRPLLPLSLYGVSFADFVRLKSMSSIDLVGTVNLKGDVVIAPLKRGKVDLFDSEVISELRKRKKWIILGPLKTSDEVVIAQGLAVDGIFVADPLLLKY